MRRVTALSIVLAAAAILVATATLLLTAGTAFTQSWPGGPGWGPGGGMMGGWGPAWPGPSASTGTRLTLDEAIQAARAYVGQWDNPDLVLTEAMEFERNFYFMVKERSSGMGAFELLVNPFTGAVMPEPGPNRMWNTKYGHPGGMMRGWGPGTMMGGWSQGTTNPATAPVVGPDQAQAVAQQWLDRYAPGSTTEQPDAFYGYYTLHILKDGAVTGMLSVNASTGAVWYHHWHGAFIRMHELEP